MTSPMLLSFRINGSDCRLDVPSDMRLADILRDSLCLTACKVGCGIGRCGACTVLMNGRTVNACLVMAWQMTDAEIVSPEGLDALGPASIVRAALADENAFQCGYCAPGFTMALTALFLDDPQAGEREILEALEGNLCRCTGYHSILRGATTAADRLRAKMAEDTGEPS